MAKKSHTQDESTNHASSPLDEDFQEEIEALENAQEEDMPDDQVSPKNTQSDEIARLTELLTRTQADYQNFKMRTERDREQMTFFFQEKILKKILPRIDDLERILKNTPENEQVGSVYEGVVALHKTFLRDLSAL